MHPLIIYMRACGDNWDLVFVLHVVVYKHTRGGTATWYL